MYDYLNSLKRRLQINNTDEDELLNDIINDAKSLYATLRHPTTKCPTDYDGGVLIEPRFNSWVVRCAVEIYSKMGVEGQTAHTELSIQRIYDSGTVSKALKSEVTPIVGVAR